MINSRDSREFGLKKTYDLTDLDTKELWSAY